MTLSPEQQQAVTTWVAAGDNLSVIQKKLSETFKISLTYMDVRFLVDDLELKLKDPVPKASSDLGAARTGAPEAAGASPDRKSFLDKAKEKLGLGQGQPAAEPEFEDEVPEEPFPSGAGGVSVSVDQVTLLPGALASGAVTFSDGVTAKWIVDNQGRPGLTEVSQPGYRPNPADAQAFMQQLGAALQKRGY
jgi:hypothetical protein